MIRAASNNAVWCAAATLAFAGCATSQTQNQTQTDTTNTTPTTPSVEAFAAGERLPPTGTISASDLVPGHAGTETWIALTGLAAPNEFSVTTGPSSHAGATSATQTVIESAEREITHWSARDDGAFVLIAADSPPDGATSLFDPPLLLAPKSLAAGAEERSESRMRIVGMSNPNSQRDKGVGARTVRYDRDEEVTWRGATVRAKVVEVRFTATLGTAAVEKTSTLWVVPGEGVIAERWHETIKILKVFDKKSEQFATRK